MDYALLPAGAPIDCRVITLRVESGGLIEIASPRLQARYYSEQKVRPETHALLASTQSDIIPVLEA